MAGLNRFLPVPPKTSLPTSTPKATPTPTIQSGSPGGRISGKISPVTRNPSLISSRRTTAKMTSTVPPTA